MTQISLPFFLSVVVMKRTAQTTTWKHDTRMRNTAPVAQTYFTPAALIRTRNSLLNDASSVYVQLLGLDLSGLKQSSETSSHSWRSCAHTYPNFLPAAKLSLVLGEGGSPLVQLFRRSASFVYKKQHNRFYLEKYCTGGVAKSHRFFSASETLHQLQPGLSNDV